MQDKKPNKIAVMQPYFFPYIGYFQLVNAVDKFVIYDDVNYIKGGYINRNSIYDCNKGSQYINILLNKASPNKQIRDIELNTTLRWRTKLLKQIHQEYRKAPHFENVYALIEGIVSYSEINLSRFLYNSLNKVCQFLGIKTELIETSVKYKNKGLDKADRLVDICQKENCEHYINPIGGQDLYDKTFFGAKNIKLDFIKMQSFSYKQFSDVFVPNLSIIDVMMFNSVEEIKLVLGKYNLV